MEAIELSDFIGQLRRELTEAVTAGKDAELRFVANSVELELQVAAETKKDGSGKLSFKVFGIGAEGGGGLTIAGTQTHKITLTMALVDKEGNSPFIRAAAGDADPI
ncbi:MAG TPA: trypco2 family protein [Allosphingosinicella sp.]